MGTEAQEVQLSIKAEQEPNEANSNGQTSIPNQSPSPKKRTLFWWIRIAVYTFLLLAGQSVALLLGRLYFDEGGKSAWMGTLVQVVGFPILLPFYLLPLKTKKSTTNNALAPNTNTIVSSKPPSTTKLASIYLTLGVILAIDCYLYSVGLKYLPVSTYSLICATQLAFNALFSFFLNSQKFTPYIINSLVLLTISSVLLIFNSNSEDNPEGVSKGKYAIGFICTIGASAGYGLMLSLIQFFMTNVLKRHDFRMIMDVILYQSLVASAVTVVGLFASGEWSGLGDEMDSYGLGKVSYVMTLTWTAITWIVFFVANVGLIVEVSALFSNAIGVLGLPIVPVLAVFVFHEKMNGLKAVAMVLAIWGFISYVYQNYLDSQATKAENQQRNSRESSDSPQREREISP